MTEAPSRRSPSSVTLLTTKLHIPQLRANLVPRPRLLERLNAGLDCKLTLISAPAGFGKTTLLAHWIHHCVEEQRSGGAEEQTAPPAPLHPRPPAPVAWLSLDEGDNDPARFLAYCVAALRTVHPELSETVWPLLGAHQPPPLEAILTDLINDLADSPQSLVLVLDDYHVITAEAVHKALDFLLEHLPPPLHLVIASRADPPLPLSRLRGQGQMVELRAADLLFTLDEATAFLNTVMGLGLSAADVAALAERTEGWIVGLQMAALSMQGRADVSAFIRAFTGSNRFVLDYLVEEVLERQPRPRQEFLLQTAVLERLTAPLCAAVVGPDGILPYDAQAMLDRLEQANLFIVPLDDERRWYRYHHLFADLLRSRLVQTQPDQVPVLHRRASAWYEQHDLIADALYHALAIDDVERVARLAEADPLGIIEQGGIAALVAWLEKLPHDLLRSWPWVCIAHAWALIFAGSSEAALSCLQELTAALATGQLHAEPKAACRLSPADQVRLAGHINAIRCWVSSVGGFAGTQAEQAIELAQQALAQLPDRDSRARGMVIVLLGVAYRHSLDFAPAQKALTEALAIYKAAGDGYVVVDLLCQLARVEVSQGYLRQAAATCQEAIRLAGIYGGGDRHRLPVASYAHTSLSGILQEWNQLDAAQEQGEQALALARRWGQADSSINGYIALAEVYSARREFDQALAHIREAKRLAYQLSEAYGAYVTADAEAMLYLAQNDSATASRLLETSRPYLAARRVSFYAARIHIAEFRAGMRPSLEGTLASLAQLLRTYEAADAHAGVIRVLILQAMARQAVGQVTQAVTTLGQALALAEPEGYVRAFIEEGPPMGELLRQAAARGLAVDYVGRLLAAWEQETKDEGRRTKAGVASLRSAQGRLLHPIQGEPLVEPLSERELEVLRLLAAGLANKAIARTLVIAEGTVKKHLKNIYGKLDAHSRTAAVARARELGLL